MKKNRKWIKELNKIKKYTYKLTKIKRKKKENKEKETGVIEGGELRKKTNSLPV